MDRKHGGQLFVGSRRNGARSILVYSLADIQSPEDVGATDPTEDQVQFDGHKYVRTGDDKFIRKSVFDDVRNRMGNEPTPDTAKEIYEKWVNFHYLQRHIVVPVFLLFFVLLLYLLGKFLAAGMGRFFLHQFEGVIHRIPLIRNVYSSVKQVTDFLFSEREIEYTRVVAVEYPRKGIWSLGMVTGESMLDIRSAANEPVLSVLMPTSPMPFTGFTVTVKKSETIDLNITIDQAFQFIVSCGVVVPPHQLCEALAAKNGASLSDQVDLPSSLTDSSA